MLHRHKARDGQHRAVGTELAHRLRQGGLQLPGPFLPIGATDFSGDPGSACSTVSQSPSANTAIAPADPSGSCGAENLCYLAGCTADRWLLGPPSAHGAP